MEMSWEFRLDPIAHVSFVGVKPLQLKITPRWCHGIAVVYITPRGTWDRPDLQNPSSLVCVCVRVFVETVQLKDQDLNARISR